MDMLKIKLAVKMGQEPNITVREILAKTDVAESLVPPKHHQCFQLLKDWKLYKKLSNVDHKTNILDAQRFVLWLPERSEWRAQFRSAFFVIFDCELDEPDTHS